MLIAGWDRQHEN